MSANDPGALPLSGLTTVVGIFDSADQAHSAAADLVAAGCAPDEISLAMLGSGAGPGSGGEAGVGVEAGVRAGPGSEDVPPQIGAEGTPEDRGALAGVSIGAVLGGTAGLLALAIPGVGPLLAAGPLAAALGGAATGGLLGGLIGSLTGLGLADDHAERYESAVRGGGILLAAHVPPAGADGVAQILTEHGARDVTQH